LPQSRIHVDVTADPQVQGNKIKLQQVLINLLKNAAHAIRDREDGRIDLRVEANDSTAIISVSDNGHGMTAELAEKIWEPLFTTKGSEGTGLGLDISRSIIQHHNGQIECQSAPNQGAKFTIRLPLVRAGVPLTAVIPQNMATTPTPSMTALNN
jgi:C4-dicarboxylate-specific signal transduction histidine kinase